MIAGDIRKELYIMDFGALFKGAGKAVAQNSSAILTALGVAGTFTTAILAAKGAFTASKIIQAEEDNRQEVLDNKEKAQLTWRCYVPSAAMAAMTVVSIVGMNRIGDRRAAAMASAYGVMAKGFEQYQNENKKKLGKTKEEALRANIAQQRIDATPNNRVPKYIQEGGPTMCFDEWSGRYFGSSVNDIDAAVNEFNRRIVNDSYASLNEFWGILSEHELPGTPGGEEVGWTTDAFLEVTKVYGTHMGNPCLVVGFAVPPTMKYDTLLR